MSDKDKEAFEKWYKDNNWMKGDLKEAWQAACEYKQKEIDMLREYLQISANLIRAARSDGLKK